MAGDTSGNGIYYRSNNGIDSNKTMLEEITAPGFGHGSYQISFVRPSGKSFIKWNTAADGSGTDYFPGDNVEQLLGSGTDLYAIWGDIPLIVQKSSIENIADAVRARQTGTPTDLGLSALATAIGAITSPATIGVKTELTGHRRLYGTSTSNNTLTLATGLLSSKVYIGMIRWTTSSSGSPSSYDLYPTLFLISNNTISFPMGRDADSQNDISLSITGGVLKLTRTKNTGGARDIYLVGISAYGGYNQYDTTAVIFRLYEAQTV